MLTEDQECLAEEAEELDMECDVMAVQTRAQRRKEQERIREDDEASALSEATPIDLPQLDDMQSIRWKSVTQTVQTPEAYSGTREDPKEEGHL
jgi:predicted GNAT superfamily acetyltransferase